MASGQTTRRTFPPLTVREFFPMPTDCAHYWEQNGDVFGEKLDQLANRYHGALFLVSGGPLAKVAISRMWKTNPGNRYLDVGSAIDQQLFGSLTRPDYIGSTRVSTFSLETYYAWKKQNLL
jgi:hypothetical protein